MKEILNYLRELELNLRALPTPDYKKYIEPKEIEYIHGQIQLLLDYYDYPFDKLKKRFPIVCSL